MSRPLAGKVALVTGASRGIGRGIAVELGKAGALVYVTGRNPDVSDSVASSSLKGTVDAIKQAGGEAIAVYVDHSKPEEVKMLFAKIVDEQKKLDILVNNVYAAFILYAAGKKFYELDTEPEADFDVVNNVGLRNHYVCTVLAARIMVKQKSGLIVNIGSTGGASYLLNVPYGFGKAAVDRLSADAGFELRGTGVSVISLWPGPVKTEYISQEVIPLTGTPVSKFFEFGESTNFAGRCLVQLAASANLEERSGKIFTTAAVAKEFNVVDVDGKTPPPLAAEKYAPYIDLVNQIRTSDFQLESMM